MVCCDPHSQRLYSIVNEAKVDVFLKFSCFLCDPTGVGNLISGSSAFSNSSLYINGHEFEQTSGDSEGQKSLACCSPWGHKDSDMT